MRIWDCKIGRIDDGRLCDGADAPMRRAVREAYTRLTGQEPNFIFSGWGATLTPIEQEIVDESSHD